MIRILIKFFIKDSKNTDDEKVREAYGVLGGTLGIICNILLFIIKFLAAILTHSVAILSDSFNNLADMGSSVVALAGAKLSMRRPDKEHPFGHGRLEYISALVVSFIIMFVGLELFKTSISKIFSPTQTSLTILTLVILIISILIKLWMFSYNRFIGKKIKSKVFIATAQDSINDMFATLTVLISAILNFYFSISVDGIAGMIVSGLIFYSGFKIAKETIGSLIGSQPSQEMIDNISSIISLQEGIVGIHDLIIHDYGPGRMMASVHAEVPNNMSIDEIHKLIDRAEKLIYEKTNIETVIHADPISINSQVHKMLKNFVLNVVKNIDASFGIHDFQVTETESGINLYFDLEVPVETSKKKREEAIKQINDAIKAENKMYNAVIVIDDIC